MLCDGKGLLCSLHQIKNNLRNNGRRTEATRARSMWSGAFDAHRFLRISVATMHLAAKQDHARVQSTLRRVASVAGRAGATAAQAVGVGGMCVRSTSRGLARSRRVR